LSLHFITKRSINFAYFKNNVYNVDNHHNSTNEIVAHLILFFNTLHNNSLENGRELENICEIKIFTRAVQGE